jgi:hypothetical protein
MGPARKTAWKKGDDEQKGLDVDKVSCPEIVWILLTLDTYRVIHLFNDGY